MANKGCLLWYTALLHYYSESLEVCAVVFRVISLGFSQSPSRWACQLFPTSLEAHFREQSGLKILASHTTATVISHRRFLFELFRLSEFRGTSVTRKLCEYQTKCFSIMQIVLTLTLWANAKSWTLTAEFCFDFDMSLWCMFSILKTKRFHLKTLFVKSIYLHYKIRFQII